MKPIKIKVRILAYGPDLNDPPTEIETEFIIGNLHLSTLPEMVDSLCYEHAILHRFDGVLDWEALSYEVA